MREVMADTADKMQILETRSGKSQFWGPLWNLGEGGHRACQFAYQILCIKLHQHPEGLLNPEPVLLFHLKPTYIN